MNGWLKCLVLARVCGAAFASDQPIESGGQAWADEGHLSRSRQSLVCTS